MNLKLFLWFFHSALRETQPDNPLLYLCCCIIIIIFLILGSHWPHRSSAMAPFLRWLNLNPSSDVNCLCTARWIVGGLCVDGQDEVIILHSIQGGENK